MSGAAWRPGWLEWSEKGQMGEEGSAGSEVLITEGPEELWLLPRIEGVTEGLSRERQTLTYVQTFCPCGEQAHEAVKEKGQKGTAVIQNQTVGAEGVRNGHVQEMLSEDSWDGFEMH